MFFSPVERIRKRAREAGTGKGSGTPLYVTGSGEVFDDSWQVLKLTGLGDVPEDVFQTLNYVIGPRTRSVTYSDLLKDEQDSTLYEFGKTAPVSWWQHFLWGISGFRRTVAWSHNVKSVVTVAHPREVNILSGLMPQASRSVDSPTSLQSARNRHVLLFLTSCETSTSAPPSIEMMKF